MSALQKGTPPGSFEFPEQALTLSGSAEEVATTSPTPTPSPNPTHTLTLALALP